MGLLAAQYEIQYSIAKITLRLNEMEEKIHHIQGRTFP